MVRNMEVSRERNVPLCQDTGVPMFYIDLPPGFYIEGDLQEALKRQRGKQREIHP